MACGISKPEFHGQALLGNTDKGSLEVATQYGWVLDAEVLLDADGHFLPLRNFVANRDSPPVLAPAGVDVHLM